MRTFYEVLINNLVATVTNNFVWFALIFWGYLTTGSVLVTSMSGGLYLGATAATAMWFGSIVDHNRKKRVMLWSSVVSLVFFGLALGLLLVAPVGAYETVESWWLWVLVVVLFVGVIAGNLRNIALPTIVTLLVDAKVRDKANGMVGMVNGLGFAITSVGSGLAVGFLGMVGVMVIAVALTLVALGHLWLVRMVEKEIVHVEGVGQKMDVKGTMRVISGVPGLWALIFFTCFNNFLGGVFMALMDAYGLSLMSVQAWGLLFGVLSFGFIGGGMLIAKFGLGKNPLRRMFLVMTIMWVNAMLFTIQPSIALLVLGMLVWMSLSPFVEATEQTIIQKVVPVERQGRVFGLAQSIEQAASPLTAFLIGPLAAWVFIPFMTTGAGVDLIGGWFGVGEARGIALVFTVAGLVGLVVTAVASRSQAYVRLGREYAK